MAESWGIIMGPMGKSHSRFRAARTHPEGDCSGLLVLPVLSLPMPWKTIVSAILQVGEGSGKTVGHLLCTESLCYLKINIWNLWEVIGIT